MFGVVWSVGASVPVDGRKVFDILIKELINVRHNVHVQYMVVQYNIPSCRVRCPLRLRTSVIY